jgi:NAD(P)-dependent dehydrogenase (short-subunit alcohol dehydrogenase family)
VGTFVVSGSASGMGAATSAQLQSQGHRVVGVDLRDADVVADLSSPAGRRDALAEISSLVGDRLDGAALFAGVGGATGRPGSLLASLNFFGSVELFTGLRPKLAAAGESSALAVCSNSMTCQPGWSESLVDAMLDGDEPAAREIADAGESLSAYPATKVALARWVRRTAASPEWAGEGIRLNAIAPGLVETPLAAEQRADPVIGGLIAQFPLPLGRGAQPEELAELAAFLLSDKARFFSGSIVLCDGGTEALLRPDSYPTRWER